MKTSVMNRLVVLFKLVLLLFTMLSASLFKATIFVLGFLLENR